VQSVSELDVRLEEMYLDVMEGDDAAD